MLWPIWPCMIYESYSTFFLNRLASKYVFRLSTPGKRPKTEPEKIDRRLILTLARIGGGVEWTPPLGFSRITRVKSGWSRRTVQYPRVNQFYTYPENFMTLPLMTFDLWPTFRDHVWQESRFGGCRLALAVRLQSFRGYKRSNMGCDVALMH